VVDQVQKARATALIAHVGGVVLSDREVVDEGNVHPFRFEGVPTALAMNGDLEDFLATFLFFNRFSRAQLDELFGGLRRLAAPRRTELVAEGERPDGLLFVLRGAVESTVHHGCRRARAAVGPRSHRHPSRRARPRPMPL
jgi:hypothetical protein